VAAGLPAPPDVLEIFLGPGDFYFGEERTRIRTILGSCVAIVLWLPRLRIGGMCHFVLPSRPRPPCGEAPDGRYADEAMQLFMAELRRSRSSASEYRARLFGGGHMFQGVVPGRSMASVCERNVEAARNLLALHGFRIESQDLGGLGHRHVTFDLWSGDVWLKRAPPRPAE
jgi:chemotaxis protein CheD